MSVLKWINTGAFTAMILVNILANLIPIGNNTTGQVSEAYPNLFTPAPITFAIWGIIYLMLAIFIVYQWGVLDRGKNSSDVRNKIGLWFAISCALNIIWMLLWHSRHIGLSTICILLLLFSLFIIQKRVNTAAGCYMLRASATAGFSIYRGWIVIAAIANAFTLSAKNYGTERGLPGEFATALIMLLCALVIAGIALVEKDMLFCAAVIWAYTGILIRHISPVYYNGSHPAIILAAFLSEAIILATIIIPFIPGIFSRMSKV